MTFDEVILRASMTTMSVTAVQSKHCLTNVSRYDDLYDL